MSDKGNGDGLKRYANEELGVSFALPARPTRRQMMNYKAWVPGPDAWVIRSWGAAHRALISEWECEHIPDPLAFDFDAPSAGIEDVADQIVMYVGIAVSDHLASLEPDEKNSAPPSSNA